MSSLTKLGLLAGLTAIATAATLPPTATRTPALSSCLAASPAAEDQRTYITTFVTTAADSEDRAGWDLPAVAADSIAFVTADSTACARGALAHARILHQDTLAPDPIYLLKVGATRFVAFNFSSVASTLRCGAGFR